MGYAVFSLDFSKADDTASDACSSVSCGLAELVSADPEVIRVCVHDQSAAYDAVGSR